jgi:hypothetical protein
LSFAKHSQQIVRRRVIGQHLSVCLHHGQLAEEKKYKNSNITRNTLATVTPIKVIFFHLSESEFSLINSNILIKVPAQNLTAKSLHHNSGYLKISKSFFTENLRIVSKYNNRPDRESKNMSIKMSKKHVPQNYIITSLHNWP